ncbi:hypothetical protein [Fusibacter sp. 3D3]|uniref:hypothetical protein n=1 Tax=Fusibacter sp. 3D3 TaxID=1048380 RepID=UPI000853D4E3|nr:hypothetical protein [Fusibacter sp. 3D3]GAU75469.1 hypothetical protein F3D3_0060 [Fusibacter sp. 3D3]
MIAGYGTGSTFPELTSLELEGSINGFIKYRIIERIAINNSRSFAAVPFAQSDAILSVFNGVSPKYRERLGDIVESANTHNSSSSFLFRNTLLNDIDTFSINEYRNPILEHGSSFRLHELVEISEFLLKFACFRSKYSNSDELSTVSEPIKIASITKFSGVKWEVL